MFPKLQEIPILNSRQKLIAGFLPPVAKQEHSKAIRGREKMRISY